MVHIAQAEQFYEQDYYTPSDEGFKVFDTEQILYVDIDMQESLKIRNAKPYTQLRRPDFYV